MNQSSAFNHNFNNENCESVDGNVRVLVKNRFRDVTCYVNLGEVRTSLTYIPFYNTATKS